jgi:hypothetical protein
MRAQKASSKRVFVFGFGGTGPFEVDLTWTPAGEKTTIVTSYGR